jgi:hypothetical protein
MKGISYLTDNAGKKTAVVLDLKRYKEELEDFLDGLEAASRVSEPTVDFETAVSKIVRKKKIHVSRNTKKIR